MGVGARIKQRREEKGINLSRLARDSGVSKGYLSTLESGDTQKPSADTLFKIAKALGVTVADLMDEHIERSKQNIPESLLKFARSAGLADTDIKMLAGIVYRGQRPETEEDWRFLYESIRRTIRRGADKG